MTATDRELELQTKLTAVKADAERLARSSADFEDKLAAANMRIAELKHQRTLDSAVRGEP